MSRTLLDTGPLVALLDRADTHHAWAVEVLSSVRPPVETCEAVISEAWYLLGRARRGRESLLGLLQSSHLTVTFDFSAQGAAVAKLMARYANVPMSVADGCLVRMAELDPKATVVTLDRDFLVYRAGRRALPLAAPFAARR